MASARTSAGLLPWRRAPGGGLEVLIGHMGGPFWAKKDAGGWSVIKGEYDPATEDAQAAARREWEEETGQPVPAGELRPLGEVRQSSGKRVVAWAVEAPGLDPAGFTSGTFTLEWPPRSGRQQEFPEIDRAEWTTLEVADERLVKAQRAFLETLRSTDFDT